MLIIMLSIVAKTMSACSADNLCNNSIQKKKVRREEEEEEEEKVKFSKTNTPGVCVFYRDIRARFSHARATVGVPGLK